MRDGGRLVGAQIGQHRQRFLVAARPDGGDGVELLGIGRVILEQHDRRPGFAERLLRVLVFFLLQCGVDRRQQALLVVS